LFELTDPAGLPSGQISVTLKWKFTYLPPSSSALTTQQTKIAPESRTSQDKEKTERQTSQDKEKTETQRMAKDPPLIPQPTVSEVMPKSYRFHSG